MDLYFNLPGLHSTKFQLTIGRFQFTVFKSTYISIYHRKISIYCSQFYQSQDFNLPIASLPSQDFYLLRSHGSQFQFTITVNAVRGWYKRIRSADRIPFPNVRIYEDLIIIPAFAIYRFKYSFLVAAGRTFSVKHQFE